MGHPVFVDGEQLVVHLLASGVCGKNCTPVIGADLVIDPEVLLREVELLSAHK